MARHRQPKNNEDRAPASLDLIRRLVEQRTLLIHLVNLGDVSTRKLDDGSSSPTRGIWLNKNAYTQRLSLRDRI
jgi:hypothetical protein